MKPSIPKGGCGKWSVRHIAVLQPVKTTDVKIWLLCFLIAGKKPTIAVLSLNFLHLIVFSQHILSMKKLAADKTYFICMW